MSITFLTGIPGSGKTYYAVNEIYENFIKGKEVKNKNSFLIKKSNKKEYKYKYKYCYTNINEFKFELDERLKLYDHNIIFEKLNSLYLLYINKVSDKELLEKAQELKLSHSLFIIDECHNFYYKENEVLIWFFTYHRHLFIDILMITQDLTLVNNKYKMIAEFFFQSLPNAKKINTNKFKYRQFLSYKMYQKDKISDFSLNKHQNVFALYQSGAINKSKSLVRKFIYIFLFLLFVLFLFFKFFVYSLNKSSPKNNDFNSEKSIPNQYKNNKINDNDDFNINEKFIINKNNYSNLYFYNVICIDYEKCFVNNDFYILFSLFKFIALNSNPLYQNIDIKNNNGLNVSKYLLIYDYEIFKNFKKRKESNEKDNSMFDIVK